MSDKTLTENWNDTKSALLEGLAGQKKDTMSAVLENTQKYLAESATAGATSSGNVAVGAVYKNKPGKTLKNKDGTAKNALDMKGVNLLTGGSIKR